MPSLNHVHTIKRVRVTRDGKPFLYMCSDPHCSFRTEKIFLVGKASLCNQCHNEFILTNDDLRRARPVCTNCSQTAKAIEFRKRRETISDLFGERKEEIVNE